MRTHPQVTQQYTVMSNVMDNAIYACDNNAIRRNCGGSTFAFVYPSDMSHKIHMCDFTFTVRVTCGCVRSVSAIGIGVWPAFEPDGGYRIMYQCRIRRSLGGLGRSLRGKWRRGGAPLHGGGESW